MKIDIYEPIRVEIENDFNLNANEETNTAIVYVGDTEIYRQDAGFMPDPDYDYNNEYLYAAKNRALIPLALFLKESLNDR